LGFSLKKKAVTWLPDNKTTTEEFAMNEKQKEVAALFLKLGIIGFEVPLPTSL
jgi:hypothetical protein